MKPAVLSSEEGGAPGQEKLLPVEQTRSCEIVGYEDQINDFEVDEDIDHYSCDHHSRPRRDDIIIVIIIVIIMTTSVVISTLTRSRAASPSLSHHCHQHNDEQAIPFFHHRK